MKICVLVKEVPDASVRKRIDPATGRLDRSGETTLNPFDTHAVEAAVQLKEGGALPVDEVVAVTMGPETATRVLHKAVSRGADRSILLTDPALAGSDVHGTSLALSRVLEREQPGLVLLGQQSGDAGCYAMATAVAEHLQMPSLTQVTSIRAGEDGRLLCERQAEYGYDSVLVELPAVLSVAEEINEPRYPSLKAIMGARSKPLEILSAERAGLAGHSRALVSCGDFADPPPHPPAQMIQARDPERAAAEIVAWLQERRLLG